MITEQLYLTDSYAREMDAGVLDIQPESPGRWRILLDRTVFYPMGGGQPTDQGVLTAGGWTGKVYQVLTKEGEIRHYAESGAAPESGTAVHGTIDWNRRYLNMRLHSAGHVIDFAMHLLGYSPQPLMPFKGDHGKKPYIIYNGVAGKDIRQELEVKSNSLVEAGMAFTTAIVTQADLERDAIYLQPGLPAGKLLRKLTLEGVGSVADGGTQVANAREVGKISIPSVTEENGTTVVRYAIEELRVKS